MSCTMSTGHSSRSSNSRRVSSGRRFLAKSRSDFKLSFNVLGVIIGCSSLWGDAAHFLNFAGQLRQELQQVVDNSDICHLEYWSLGVLVDSDDERIAFEPSQMLKRAADAAGQINFRFHRLPRRPDLPRLLQPLGIHHRA